MFFNFTFDTVALIVCLAYGLIMGIGTAFIAGKLLMSKSQKYNKGLTQPYSSQGKKVAVVIVHFAICAFFGFLLPLLPGIFACLLTSAGVCGIVVDRKIRIIPNEIVIVVAACGVALRFAENPSNAPWAFLVLGITFVIAVALIMAQKKIRGNTGMGAGDFKLLLACSLAAGWPSITAFLIGFAIALVAMSVYMLAILKKGLKAKFPMCESLMIGLFLSVIYPHTVMFVGW